MPVIHGESYPDYSYQEYPKWVVGPDGKSVIVEGAHEELMLLGAADPIEIQPEDTATEFVHVDALDGPLVQETPTEEGEPASAPEDAADVVDSPVDVAIAPDGSHIADIDSLRAHADALGLIYDKRWGALKLHQAIDNAAVPTAPIAE